MVLRVIIYIYVYIYIYIYMCVCVCVYDMATYYVRALRVDMQCPLLLSTALGSESGKVIGSGMYELV